MALPGPSNRSLLRVPAAALGLGGWFLSAAGAAEVDFQRDVAPLLREHCTECHGGAKQKGGLDLRSLDSTLEGGDSGPAFVAGNPAESRLVTYLDADSDPHMPPKGQLEEAEMSLVRDWVAGYREASPGAPAEVAPKTPVFPPGVDPRLAIDALLERSWNESGIAPAPAIDDAAYLRRVTLDLLGRIPTREERDHFLAETDTRKRERLVDGLLASKEHARHLAEIFNVVLLGRERSGRRRGNPRDDREKHLLPYLRWAFETNRPWNEVGRDLIVGRPQSPEERGAAWFLYEQRNDADEMATATSAALFGKQVQCAQCHDHPVAPEIEQKHYWGLVAFFDRSVNVNTKDGPRVAEKAAGGYAQFANLEGKSSESELVFFTGAKVEEPDGRRDQDAAEHYSVAPPQDWIDPPKNEKKDQKRKITTDLETAPVPKFSRREELARIAIEENPEYARAFVNRAWALLMGRGFVHPVDQMNSAHPPSHPELLDWLAEDLAASGYDVRRLFRAIVTSRAYALLPAHPADVRPLPETFARALDKPLPAEALYRSMLVALGAPVQDDGAVAGEDDYREIFVENYPELFAEVFSPSVQQAMFTTNGHAVDRMLRDANLPLVTALRDMTDDDALVTRAFLAALGREPDSAERERSIAYLNERAGRREEAVRQFLWALFAGAEFRMNH